MDIIKTYGNTIKKNIEKPQRADFLIRAGLTAENIRVNHFIEKEMPESLKYLNRIGLQFILNPLNNPDNCGFVNLFAPCELLHAMNIYPLLIEAYACFMSGLKCEDSLIDSAERAGIAETLCSYHKVFLGAIESGIISKPKFAITSSMICDANSNTFRYAAKKYDVPYYIIDIPYDYNEQSEKYVVDQLVEMIDIIEKTTGKSLNMDKLREVLHRENETKKYMLKYLERLKDHDMPNTLTLEMYKLFATHVQMGSKETYNFFKLLSQDILNYKRNDGYRIFWVHLLPFYDKTLRQYFNYSQKFNLIGCDLNMDHLEQLNEQQPLKGLAQKMILNANNGGYERRIDYMEKILKGQDIDGVINFCHWGCRQSSGGYLLLKNKLDKMNIPFLALDGDAIDRRNNHEGQIKTRLEAFLELLKQRKDLR